MYIENINGPADVKKLNIAQMTVLASEMRDALLIKLSRHGGHFGPSPKQAGLVGFQLAGGLVVQAAGIAAKPVVAGAALGHDPPHRADDEPVEQRQSDKKVHQLEQEGYVEADHAENPPAGTQRDSACASAAINAVPGNC